MRTMIPSDSVETWWPNEMGAQPLYDLTVELLSSTATAPLSAKTVRVGFRTLLVEQPPISLIVGNPDANGTAFYFKARLVVVFYLCTPVQTH